MGYDHQPQHGVLYYSPYAFCTNVDVYYNPTLRKILLSPLPHERPAPDIFQEVMSNLFGDFIFVVIYVDDVLIITHGNDDVHLEHISQVFALLMQISGDSS